ncbi:hypothetical protein K439DRAFT_1383314 [Ramaria rubella]|nr:hypothetical protein K439DRAFT_1383314 [Ramaria rubella]
MAKRRDRGLPQSHSSLNLLHDSGPSPISSPPHSASSFRAASPSITGFLSKPSKWFSRPSNPKPLPSAGAQDTPRLSTSSASRRPTISGPTDPRPILPEPQGHLGGSRSVLDLALTRTQTHGASGDGVPEGTGIGDLRSVSRKGWSRSVDDLGRFPTIQTSPANTSDIKLSTSSPQDESTPSPTKAMIEAYRRNTPSSPHSPSNSPHSLHPHYPFPTIQTTSPFPSSPASPSSHGVPDLNISPAHNRSFSHAPFQSSKLASPSSLAPVSDFPLQLSPSQSRTRTVSSFEREHDKEKTSRAGLTFPFSATGAANKQLASGQQAFVMSPGSLPTPPPPISATAESKRTSQIVHYSGFINRHPDGQPAFRSGQALSAALAKGWKPYKAILKGSKLYFFKPPSDRTVAIRELFPQGIDPGLEDMHERPETVQEEPEPAMKLPGKDREDARKRLRLYRGRATHPELSLAQDGSVARGSGDALIHEAVFGTSFKHGGSPEIDARWKHFASAVVLCLPILVGKAKFEGEFFRYADYLIAGAEDGERTGLRARTMWLAEQYLFHQGGPADEEGWDLFRTQSLPSLSFSVVAPPQLDSPDLGTFSPRPSQSQTLSSFTSFSAVVTPPRPSISRPSLSHSRSDPDLWSILERDGLTGDIFLKMDSTVLARSLLAFHRAFLAQNLKPFLGADVISCAYDNENQVISVPDKKPFDAFFGSDDNPHWLTRFIVVQVLAASGTATSLSHVHSDAVQVSKSHLRSDLISKWVRVGDRCRLSGDRCSWKAIEAALCSRPIARLDKVWKRVDGSAIRSINTWLKSENETSPGDRMLTPWGGDLHERVTSLLQQARIESNNKDDQWDVSRLNDIFGAIEPVSREFLSSSKLLSSVGDPALNGHSDDTAQLTRFWHLAHAQPPPRSSGLNSYMSQSLATEPCQKGRFEPYHWQRPLNGLPVHTLVPLLFVEPLPTVTLIDRDQIYRGKKESLDGIGGHPGLDESQVARMARMKSSPDVRRQSRDLRTRESTKLLPGGEMGGTILRMHEGELLLLVPETLPEPGSRPPSSFEPGLERRPSQIRPTNPSLERKTSMARRNSLPSLSQRNSVSFPEPTSEMTLRIVVKAGTLDRLVDVLISGFEGISVAVADDNGEMPLREGRTKSLRLDRDEFRATWWSVFRSFVTPLVLFEFLRKRFFKSNVVAGPPPKIRLEIFSVLHDWIDRGCGAQDALGDPELFDAMNRFLMISATANIPDGINVDDSSAWAELESARYNTQLLFRNQTRRPRLFKSFRQDSMTVSSERSFGSEPPSIDGIDPEAFVDNMNALTVAAMRSVTQEDLFITIDFLEVQSADRAGWFLSHEPSTSTDDVEIQTIYSHLQQIEPSILISELAQESVYKLLPPSIRSIIRAHAVMRKWIMAQIVAPRLGLRARQARMETLLQAVEICRLRMAELPVHQDVVSQRSVRSFVETAIIAAIVSPESRLFSFAWLSVAAARGTTADSVGALLSGPVVQSVSNKDRLTIDMGWLLERLLEVISVPNIIDSDREALNLINYDKRRHLSDLVSTAIFLPPRSRKDHGELDRIDLDRLNNMHREVTGPPFDTRALRDDAYHESFNVPLSIPHTKKNQRPFLRLVQAQQEKCKRDKYLRERVLREKKAEQQRTDKREDDLNRAMRPNSQSIKHQRSRRTMSSAFFNLMRPLSSAFSSTDNLYVPNQKRTAAELDFQPSGKPTLVISLVGATVVTFNNDVRLYTFHLTTEDGGLYLLQAATRSAFNAWLTAISQTAKSSTAKRLTYIANPPKPQLSDHIQLPSQTSLRHPTAVFGVELDFLLQREAGGRVPPPGAVPHVLEQCLSEIEARGLQEVGIYRIPGATSAINALRHEFDSGEKITFFSQEYVDIFAVCDTVKTWFRSLPFPLFPEKSYSEVIRVMQISDFEERLLAVRDMVHGLPVNNFYLLRRICEHLERVTDYEEHNQMTAQALAVLFNPTLLRSPMNDFGVMMHNMNFTSQLLQTLIIHFHRVFDDTDVDQDDEAEPHIYGKVVELDRIDSRSSSVPTDAIHDHDPDLEPFPSSKTTNREVFPDSPLS